MVLSHLTFNYIAVFRTHVLSGDFSEVLELAGGHSPFIHRAFTEAQPSPFQQCLLPAWGKNSMPFCPTNQRAMAPRQ